MGAFFGGRGLCPGILGFSLLAGYHTFPVGGCHRSAAGSACFSATTRLQLASNVPLSQRIRHLGRLVSAAAVVIEGDVDRLEGLGALRLRLLFVLVDIASCEPDVVGERRQ